MGIREYVVEGLIKRGLPPHVAEGFAMNFEDESGFNPSINEANPVVPGSRGGFGLYQLTGPRRTTYEEKAARAGVDPGDVDMQLDHLVWELNNTERPARDRIMATRTPGQAGAAVLNHFLRPAEEHRARREAKYLGDYGNNVLRNMAPGAYNSEYQPTVPMRDQTPGVTNAEFQPTDPMRDQTPGIYNQLELLSQMMRPNQLDPQSFMRQPRPNALLGIPGVTRG